MTNFDMHFHSNASDWTSTPQERIIQAKELWLDFIALTDHDKISKDSFIEETNNQWIQTCYSTEISARNYEQSKSIHITAYSQEFNQEIKNILQNTVTKKKIIIEKQVLKLKEMWFNIDIESFILFNKKLWRNIDTLNKYDISTYILQDKYNLELAKKILWPNVNILSFFISCLKEWWEFSWGFLVERIPEYEPSIEVCWELAKTNNAILSIAHPNVSFEKEWISWFEKELPYYIDRGVNAIEINSKATKGWIEALYKAKEKYNLILTAGSDNHDLWHSDNKHWYFWELNPLLSKKQKSEILNEVQLFLNK